MKVGSGAGGPKPRIPTTMWGFGFVSNIYVNVLLENKKYKSGLFRVFFENFDVGGCMVRQTYVPS